MAAYRMSDIVPLLEREASAQGVDPSLVKALLVAENTADGIYRPDQAVSLDTTSPAGATGVGQVMPSTKAQLIKKNLLSGTSSGNPLMDQIRAMVAVVKDNNSRTGGDPLLSAIHYNTSSETFQKFKDTGDYSVLPAETRQYIDKVGQNVKVTASQLRVPPAAMENVVDAAGNYITGMQKNLGLIHSIVGETSAAAAEQLGAIDEAAAATTKKITAETAGKVAGIQQKENVLHFFGIDRNDPQSALTQANQTVAIAQQEVLNLQPQLEALKNVNFVDDPLKWVGAQIQLAPIRTKYNNAAMRYNTASQFIVDAQGRTAAQLNAEPASNVPAIQDEAAASAELALANAKIAKSKVVENQRTSRLSELMAEMQWNGIAFTQAKDMARLMAEHLSLREVNDKLDKDQQLLASVNVVRAKMGLDPIASINEYKAMSKKHQDLYAGSIGNSSGAIAGTPGSSLAMLYDAEAINSFATKLPDAQKLLNTWGRAAQEKAIIMKQSQSRLSDDDAFTKAANEINAEWQAQIEKREYDKLPASNPLRMDGKLFAAAKALDNNSVAQYVRKLPQTGVPVTESQIFQYAVGQVTAGKPKEQVAQEVRDFFEYGFKNQVSARGLGLLGINFTNPKTKQVEYPMRGDFFSWSEMMFNPRLSNAPSNGIQGFSEASISNYLLMNAIKAKTLEIMNPISTSAGEQLP